MTDTTFATAEQVREYGKQAIGAYEQVVKSAVDFEKAAADAAPADWIKTAIGTHASFVAEVNAAYVGAVRSALN